MQSLTRAMSFAARRCRPGYSTGLSLGICLLATAHPAWAGTAEPEGAQPVSASVTPTMTAPSSAPDWAALADRAAGDHGELGRRAVAFLQQTAPPADAGLATDLLWSNIDLALRARSAFPWASAVPEAMFLNDVLPYAVFDETRENWRPDFHARCSAIVADAETAEEAIQALNRELFNQINVHYNTGRKRPNQSPSESIAQGRATCTGLSVILVYACRSVGIPARAAGVARWKTVDGNHTWVEAWDGERWRFTGADEYDKNGLDRGWFNGRAAQAVAGDETYAVWATSWQPTGHRFPMVWDMDADSVHAVDVTDRYAPPPADAGASHASPEAGEADLAAARVALRTWHGNARIAAQVRVVAAHGGVVATKTTKAGTHDLNDMPVTALTPGAVFEIEVLHDGEVFVQSFTPTAGDQTLDLRLENLERALTPTDAQAEIARAWQIIARTIAARPAAEQPAEQPDQQTDAFTRGAHTMRILERTFGDAPDGERSLWISMHGGGGAPAEVNDRQWQNQIKLYEPEEGIYIAPRAPTDSWNLWHQAHIDELFDDLISTYVATRGVDPDRVYLLGYSAGGDGVYQLAPRMADRFAAASMMAGHPNETTPEGLRNLPFAIFMGGKDAAYDRNTIAAGWGEKLAELQANDPAGYPHRVTIYPEHGHWMNRDDREALPWMSAQTRNAWPNKIVWKQDDVTHTRFYWLEVAPEAAKPRAIMTAQVEGQTISLDTGDLRGVTLHLSDKLIDLDAPITVIANGTEVFNGTVRRTKSAIARSLASRRDPGLAGSAVLSLAW